MSVARDTELSRERPSPAGMSPGGIRLLKALEGAKRRRGRHVPYKDQAGHRTVGYGHLIRADEFFPAGGISEARAETLLRKDVAKAETAVDELVDVPLSQAQFDALCCLAFNIGVNAFKRSTALRKLNEGDYAGCAEAMKLWCKVTVPEDGKRVKKVSRGLVNRRNQEVALFLSEPPPAPVPGISVRSDIPPGSPTFLPPEPKQPEPQPRRPWWRRFFFGL